MSDQNRPPSPVPLGGSTPAPDRAELTGDYSDPDPAAPRPVSGAASLASPVTPKKSLRVLDCVIIEVHDAVRLRPDAHAARNFVVQGVLQKQFAVDVAAHFLVVHDQLQLVPFLG
jgi:hypothetical protein